MTTALHADLVGRLRNSQTAATDPDCLTEQAADAIDTLAARIAELESCIESLERQLALADECIDGCAVGMARDGYLAAPAIARHRARMKEGK